MQQGCARGGQGRGGQEGQTPDGLAAELLRCPKLIALLGQGPTLNSSGGSKGTENSNVWEGLF